MARKPKPARRWGLTGGIGSGKSSVARWLADRGAEVVDADLLARECTLAGGAAIPQIAEVFGPLFIAPDGSMDRPRMRERVFADSAAKRQLEAIVHPHVQAAIQRQVQASCAELLVFDIPLLVESPHWRHQLDQVLVIDCPRPLQIHRVVQRNGLSESAVEAIIDSQAPRTVRLAAADRVIVNDQPSLSDLHRQLQTCAHWFGL